MTRKGCVELLRERLQKIYHEKNSDLPFHGWHHITFVTKKAIAFANSIDANIFLVESAALVHDLNYVVRPNSESVDGKELRQKILFEIGYTQEEIDTIEVIIQESSTEVRDENISNEGKALSDADTLFKSLPLTPVIFASKYMTENKINIHQLVRKIISEQSPLLERGIYFYTELAKEKYLNWAKLNLDLWNRVNEALMDEDVKEMLDTAKKLGAI